LKGGDLGKGKGLRANVQLPPGWGKTLYALKSIAELAANKNESIRTILYVTPNLKLVDIKYWIPSIAIMFSRIFLTLE
jgi:hypothetical protein